MGALRAGTLQTVGQSTAQFIDGSLRFDKSKNQYLQFTPSSSGNRKTWTFSCWIKRNNLGDGTSTSAGVIFGSGYPSVPWGIIQLNSDNTIQSSVFAGASAGLYTNALFRDTGSFFHLCSVFDTTASGNNKWRTYINGVQQTYSNSNYPSDNTDYQFNQANANHRIGYGEWYAGLQMSQCYFIDGQALGPEYFGYTDPLTNTWRPKKYKPQATPNDGTVWSNSSVSGSWAFSDTLVNAFDGNPASVSRAAASQATTITLIKEVPFTTSVKLTGSVDNAGGQIYVKDGTDTFVNVSSGFNASSTVNTVDITSSLVSPIKAIKLDSVGNGYARMSYLEIDGVALVDGDTSNIGVNGFHLPFDGSAPIGQDQSGRGNDWTPVNFGGSAALDKATGALPILNTFGSNGKIALPSTRTDTNASNIVMAIPFLGNVNDISANIKGSGSNLTVTTSGSPAADSDPTQWYGSSFSVSTNNFIDEIGTTSTFAFLHQPEVAGTIEGWINTNAVNVQGPWFQTSNGTDQIGVMFRQNSTTNLAIQINRGVSGQAIVIDSAITVALNTWYHWAFVKSADGFAQFFLNGQPTGDKVPISTAAGAANAASTSSTSTYAGRIAKNNAEARGIGANISDYRAYTIQKYAFDTPFIPASTDPDILPDTPSGVSYSSNFAKITDGAVAFDGSGDYLSVANNSDFVVGTSDFTMECYVYQTSQSSESTVFGLKHTANASSWRGYAFYITTGGALYWLGEDAASGGWDVLLNAGDGTISLNRWHHISATRDGTTFRLFIDGILQTSATSSVDLNDTGAGFYVGQTGYNTQYFNGFISNLRIIKGTALYTSNFTPPSAPLTNVTNTVLLCCQSTTSATATAVAPGTSWSIGSTLSEPVKAFDGSTSTSTIIDTTTRVLTNESITVSSQLEIYTNNFNLQTIRLISGDNTYQFENHPSNNYLVLNNADSQNNTPFTGTLSGPISIVRSAGSAALYAVRVDGTILVDPIIANGNAAATNFNPFTTDINAVRGQETGYATLNPLIKDLSLTNGNLESTESAARPAALATLKPSTGKWYYEVVFNTGATPHIGLFDEPQFNTSSNTSSYVRLTDGQKIGLTGGTFTAAIGDVVQCAIDFDNSELKLSKNGTGYTTFAFNNTNASNCTMGFLYQGTINFGQKPFKFPPPEGFLPLNAANVRPSTVIARPDQYVGIVTYNGSNSVNQIISVSGTSLVNGSSNPPQFNPDFVWVADRFTNGGAKWIFDSVRGSNKYIQTNNANQEGTRTFTINNSGVSIPAGDGSYNYGGKSYVALLLKAGGSGGGYSFWKDDVGYATASAAGLTSGTKTPTAASVSTKSGFSIIAFTGDETAGTISHGLGRAPSFYVVKSRDSNSGGSNDWYCYHSALGASARIQLNSPSGQTTGSSQWNNTSPTSSVLSIGAGSWQETDDRFIIYAWADVPGLQKFGSYTGNASYPDGPFVYLGFKPEVLILRNPNATENWTIQDNKRDPYNVVYHRLDLENSNPERAELNTGGGTINYPNVDFLSNGFKVRSGGPLANPSGTVIYMAWAEAPTFNLYGGQSNAR